jgi:hypothetical protein
MGESKINDPYELRRRQEEVRRILDEYSEVLIDRRTVKELGGMLSLLNYLIFGLVGWIAYGNLFDAPVGPTSAWAVWLIWAPMGGFLIVGIPAWMGWHVVAYPLGEFLFNRQHKPLAATWWRRLMSDDLEKAMRPK